MRYVMLILTVVLFTLVSNAKTIKSSHLKTITKVAKEFGLNSNKMIRIAYVESKFNPLAVRHNKNKSIDYGLFQINSIHWNTTCKQFDIFDLEGNVRCAATLIMMHKKHAKTDPLWLGRYNSKTPKYKQKYFDLLMNVPDTVLVANVE